MTQGRLPEAEQDVLGVLYDLGEATAREVRERLEPRRPLAHASVVTLLNRLEEKRLVRRRPSERGKAFLFAPTRERTRTFGPMVSRLAKRVFQGDHIALVASLFESRPPDAREIERLEQLLDEWRAQPPGRWVVIDVLAMAGSRWLSLVWPMMWQGSAVALVALALLPLARRVGPSLALGLLGVAVAKFFMPPVAASPMALLDATVAALRPPGRVDGDELFGSALAIVHVIGLLYVAHGVWQRQRWLSQVVAGSMPHRHDEIGAAVERIARATRLRRIPDVRVTPLVETPMAAGVFHPVVLLPPSAAALGQAHRDVVLAHELAHHRAHDLLFEWILAVVTAVWWFNPVVWALAAQIREVREDRCDDRVLMLGVDPRTYCRVLLDVAAARLKSPALAIRHATHPLERRFARLLAPRRAAVARQMLAVPVTIVFATLALPHSSWSPRDRADEVRSTVNERVRIVVEQRVVR